ncbi:MAG TPA: head-tail adaptor protein [Chloroflexota bacterium]|nr:head-tail adaptor protein [Chloroflexota bacterium]
MALALKSYIEAGKLNRPIRILDPTIVPDDVQDSFGSPLNGQEFPVLVGTDWGKIEFLGTATLYSLQEASTQVSHRVTIRWRPGIKATQQIYYVDDEQVARLLQIRAVANPDEGSHMLLLECLERPDLLAQIQTVP